MRDQQAAARGMPQFHYVHVCIRRRRPAQQQRDHHCGSPHPVGLKAECSDVMQVTDGTSQSTILS